MEDLSAKVILNKVMNIDCLKGAAAIKDKSVDMVFCDLPFGETQNSWDNIIPFDELWNTINKVIKDTGVIALCSAEPFTSMLIMSNLKNFKYKIIWEKSKATNFLNSKKQPLRKYEEIVIFYKKQPTYNPQFTEGEAYNKGVRKDQLTGSYGDFKPVEVKSNGKRYPTDVLYFKTAENEGNAIHPNQKPIALCEYIIKTYTNEGMKILDLTTGYGSIPLATIKLNRIFIAFDNGKCEKKGEYYGKFWSDLANERIDEYRKRVNLKNERTI